MTNKTNRQQQSKQQPSIIIITLITCLGGVLSGYHQGVISVSLPSLKKEFHLTDTQEETVAGSLFLGGVFGCWLGGYICDYVGRKKAILTCDFVFILGSIITSTQRNSINQVLIGRGVTGFAVALSGISNVSYLTEMAPSNTSRGSIVSANELSTSFGFLLAFFIGYIVASASEYGYSGDWRTMFGAPCIIAIIQLLFMLNMPESEVWLTLRYGHESTSILSNERGRSSSISYALKSRNRDKGSLRRNSSSSCGEADEKYRDYVGRQQKTNFASKANKYTAEVNNNSSCSDDYENSGFLDPNVSSRSLHIDDDDPAHRISLTSVKEDDNDDKQKPTAELEHEHTSGDEDGNISFVNDKNHHRTANTNKFHRLLIAPPGISPTYYYQSIVIILYLALAQQFCGHINILNFAPDIFAQAMGYDDAEAEHNDAQSLIPMLFLGSIKFIVTAWVVWEVDTGIGRRPLYILGVAFICFGLFLLICAFAGETDFSRMTTAQEVTTVLGVASVVIGYAASFGPLTWLVTAELFPASVRGRALGYSEVVTMASAWLVSYTYLSGQDILGPAVPFAFYFVCTMITLLFIIIAVPDTGSASTSADDSDLSIMEYEMSQMWLWNNEKRCSVFQLPSATELIASDINYVRKAEFV